MQGDFDDTPRPHGAVLGSIVAPVRRFGVRSFVIAVSITGLLAGLLSASGTTLPLSVYVAMTAALYAAVLGAFMLSGPRYRFWVFSLMYRRPVERTPEGRPRFLHVEGVTPGAPVLQIAAARTVDRVYENGFRILLESNDPVAVIASSPRDVSRPDRFVQGMFADGDSRTRCIIDPTQFGVPLASYGFERSLPESTDEVDHPLAVKDMMFLPELAESLQALNGSRLTVPFTWPEHCVDVRFLASHDLIVIGAGDSNFWHGALFEPVCRAFSEPRSAIPLALEMRERDEGVSLYGSRTIRLRLSGRGDIPLLAMGHSSELDERRFPTCAMILACENPFAAACNEPHWCVFVAGTRALGTSGALLGLAAMIRNMRKDAAVNYASYVDTESADVRARVSAVLCRTIEVEYAAPPGHGRRGRRPIPTDRRDEHYDDSYVATAVEYLDNSGATSAWRPLVRIT